MSIGLSKLTVQNLFSDRQSAVVDSDVVSGHKNPLHLKFPERLREILGAANKSQRVISELTGLPRTSICAWEGGIAFPRLDRAERLAIALGVKPSWLAYGPEGAFRFRQRRTLPVAARIFPAPSLRSAIDLPLGADQLAQRVKLAREQLGLSLRALGAAAGASGQVVMMVERGNPPLINTVEALAVALDVSPGWLAFGDGEGPETWAN